MLLTFIPRKNTKTFFQIRVQGERERDRERERERESIREKKRKKGGRLIHIERVDFGEKVNSVENF